LEANPKTTRFGCTPQLRTFVPSSHRRGWVRLICVWSKQLLPASSVYLSSFGSMCSDASVRTFMSSKGQSLLFCSFGSYVSLGMSDCEKPPAHWTSRERTSPHRGFSL
jgi:hypothetical protein